MVSNSVITVLHEFSITTITKKRPTVSWIVTVYSRGTT